MKIIFLCGSVEPGQDGVGDYTQALARELINQGHETNIIALNDSKVYVESEIKEQVGNSTLSVIRLPFIWTTKQKNCAAQKWIKRFNPEWISLQFVIFSFHSKGLPLNLNLLLRNLGKGRRWHLMFHELWVGMQKNTSFKYTIWGWCQRKIISALILKLKPEVIQTQSRLYLFHLTKLGLKVDLLPLFSNIPVDGVCVKPAEKRNKNISMVIFGTIHLAAPVEQLIRELSRYKKKYLVNFNLTLVGRCGAEQDRWISLWKSAHFNVKAIGEQPIKSVSRILNSASIGISTTALAMIDKSGTVAAMLTHGLPVICVAKHWDPGVVDPIVPPEGIFKLEEGCIEACLKINLQKPAAPTTKEVAQELISKLSTYL